MEPIVAIDIETTGLDPEKDAIIEIGAVRFSGRRWDAEWHTLIHPGRRIPPFITQLTGITDQMVLQAPPIQDVLADLEAFVGDDYVLGHNVNFDLAFLRRHGVLRHNTILDTYEMASVLIPNAGRYNLGALAQALGAPYPATHRALDDAHATRGVFLRLYDQAMELPLDLLAEIVRLGEGVDWGGYWPLRLALRARSREIVDADAVRHRYSGPLFSEKPERPPAPLQPIDEPQPLDIDEVSALLESGGAFARHFPNFEHRPEQVAMLQAVAEALSYGRHLLVEAGTGTGKSMAYLIPAALWAIQNQRRVVISTNTINLQDQLINKDIPDLRAALGVEVRAAVLKGRSNYLCPRRLESLRRRGPENTEEMRILAKALVWLQGTRSGDRAEINLNRSAEWRAWMRISAEDEACTTENCLKHTGGACPFYRARQAANSAHILIVNHALLLADVATGNRVLPEYEYLIVDEAHHLESATTNALSYHVSLTEVERTLRVLGGPGTGVLGWTLSATQEVLQPDAFAAINHLVQGATDLAFRFEHLARRFFTNIDQFLAEQRQGHPMSAYAHQERIVPATRTQPAWMEVEVAWDEAQLALVPLVESIEQIAHTVAEVLETLFEDDEELFGNLVNLYRSFYELHQNLNALVFEPSEEQIYWAEIQSDGRQPSLHAAPLHIGALMERFLWHEKTAVILTSATMTAAGDFDYIRGRLQAVDAYELALGSPFDYETAALLYLVNDIPEPSDRNGHQRAVEAGLIRLCRATGGKALVLFTSYDQLRRTSQAIAPALARDEILVYEQGEGASPHALLEIFRGAERAVLLGTRAFWEGVDVPGEALSALVIVKLPFDVPSDPIVAARAETFEDSFYQYSLPEAILRFRQGFGRLIRTQYDRGVVAIFDRRVLSKRYGRLFIDSLPRCSVQTGSLEDLPRAAAQWLNL
ncbi:MAG: DEAD/DEAH box helicase family protein [Anaerolineales bacterium]|nr:DEAD/DEAH box helicase family protein [Anaerolineales bacterium]